MRQTYFSVKGEYAKAFKRIRRKRQEDFFVYGEYADRHKIEPVSANFRPKPKNLRSEITFARHDGMGKKTISRFCPFK